MGVNFVKGKIGKISEKETEISASGYEDINAGKLKVAEHDMVILSVGALPNTEASGMFVEELKLDKFKFVGQPDLMVSPAKTSIEGVLLPEQLPHRWIFRMQYCQQGLLRRRQLVI